MAGVGFDLDVAGAVAGLDEDPMLDAVDAALRTGLVVEETADRYRFAHDIVRRTLVAQLSAARLRALHRRTADAVERLRGRDLDAEAAVLAHHAAAGADPGGDLRAVLWARRASAQASGRRAPAEAARLCRQALTHVPPDDGALLAEVTTELGAAELAAGEPGGATTLAEGASLARRHGRPDVVGRAALALADAAEDQPDHRTAARELVDVALAAGPPPPDDPEPDAGADAGAVLRAQLLVRRLRLGAPVGGDLGAPDAELLLAALHRRTAEQGGPAHLDERRRLADELATLADAVGDVGFAMLAAHHQAMAAAESGDETVVDKAVAVLEDAARRGDGFAAAMLAERAVASLTVEGRVEDARAALDAAVIAAAAAAGDARPAPGPEPGIAGRPEARLLLDPPEAVASRHRVVLGWLAGVDPPADVLVAPAARRCRPAARAGRGRPGRDRRRPARGRGRGPPALAPYADRTCGVGYRSFAGSASFHLGRLAAAAGDWSDAERHLQAALRHHTLLRARPWVALTQRALAEVIEARGRTSDRDWIAGLRSEADHVTSTLGLRAD